MADWFVGPVMEKLIDACSEYLKDQVRWQSGMPEELQRLRDNHPRIQAVVSAYGQAQIEDPSLDKWLWQLRDAVDEADDVLDDLEYTKQEQQVSRSKKTRKMRSVTRCLERRIVIIGKRALKIDHNLRRLEAAVQKLDKISAGFGPFLHLLDNRRQEQQQQQLDMRRAREMGSMATDNLLGRSKEMEFVRRWLSDVDQAEVINTGFYKNISVLSVVGHGGMGKTTLLQHIYDDGMTKGFDVKVWVCVPDNFNAKTVIKSILESLKKETPHLESLDLLQRSLQTEVMSKRFLLVLDDVWEEDKEKWKIVLAPLCYGSLRSKILVTTRMDSVANMFANMIKNNHRTLQLRGLEEAECLQILNTHAFAGVEDPDVHKKLRFIARERVKKLSGCPLAAKVIGGILNFNLDESYWSKVLNNDIGNVEPGKNDLLPILKLSYIYLPKYLQNCFAFCCMFPQDHEFDKNDLVRMWIALGFIQSSDTQGETLEEIGGQYFDILVKKSFFDEFYIDDDVVYYKMHNLLYDLAQFVSTQECFKVMDDKELRIPETIRHLSIQTSNLKAAFKKVGEFKNLRSLFLSVSNDAMHDENFMDVLSEILKASKSIRLLAISAEKLEKIPDTINCLVHLRYLRFYCSLLKLPRSLSHLYHLQFLIYKSSWDYHANDFLPRDINNLYNLRYLELPSVLYSMISEIGKLKSLQELNYFYVQNEIGYGIRELEHMNKLRQIVIYRLENIKDAEEACSAKIYDKKNLAHLSLNWGDDRGIVDEEVLDGIQPCNNLKRLRISAYMGLRSATWMNDVCFAAFNLEHIRLDECLKWQILPPFGRLPFLKSLYLYNMPEAMQLDHNKDCMFPSLEVLHIENLEALKEWFGATTAAENGCLLPCLTELCLRNCPKLQELPSLPTKLWNLRMDNIGWKAGNWLQGIRNCSLINVHNLPNLVHLRGRQGLKINGNFQLMIDELVINDPSVLLMMPLRHISSFRSLTIEENDELLSFTNETEQWFLQLRSSLSKLNFDELQSLQSLPSSWESFSSLNTLRVSNLPRLKLLPKLPSSLEILDLYNLKSLQCLPSCLSTISSLKHLTCVGTSQLKYLPDLPTSLEQIVLHKLRSLQRMPSSLRAISSLTELELKTIPLLESLPDLPSSLEMLDIEELDSLRCLPSSLSAISSLWFLKLDNVPLLKTLPDLPSSLKQLELAQLESLQSLSSSLPTFSSLTNLELRNIPLLKSLRELPSSLTKLLLEELESLDCLPSSLPALRMLRTVKVPRLLALPELPASLKTLHIIDCHPQLMERYKDFFV